MSSATLPSGLHVLQALHEDWQTVGALVSEIGAFQIEGLPPHGDVEMLVVRLCARLYALSQVEMELLYPLLENCPALDSGRTLHEQVVGDVHALLDAVVEDDHFEASSRACTSPTTCSCRLRPESSAGQFSRSG